MTVKAIINIKIIKYYYYRKKKRTLLAIKMFFLQFSTITHRENYNCSDPNEYVIFSFCFQSVGNAICFYSTRWIIS